jgi:hypothetical protein
MVRRAVRRRQPCIPELMFWRQLGTGSGSRFCDTRNGFSIYSLARQKKTLTRMWEANIYNNMLCIIESSTQE